MKRLLAPATLFALLVHACTHAQTAGLQPLPLKPFPRTLIAGTFRIEVERYDLTAGQILPGPRSGVGRIRFACQPVLPPFPWGDLPRLSHRFTVVEEVNDPHRQITLDDALLIAPDVKPGEAVELTLPRRSTPALLLADKEHLLGLLHDLVRPRGIPVRFRDATWSGPAAATVTLSSGIATYPATAVTPPLPAHITVAQGFGLAIDSLIITPAHASVKGSILLPPCLVSTSSCTRPGLPFPWTRITALCDLYSEVPDSTFGPMFVGETGIQVRGRGYTLDFSANRSDASVTPPLPASWKGVVLHRGATPDPPSDPVISNRGYLQAPYTFVHGLVTASGLSAQLRLAAAYAFETVEPLGYRVVVRPPNGAIQLRACGVEGGEFLAGEIQFPTVAVLDESGQRVTAAYDTLRVQRDMDLFGTVTVNGGFAWGEFSKTSGSPRYFHLGEDRLTGQPARGFFYLAARQRLPYYPTAGGTFQRPMTAGADSVLETQGVQGITLTNLRGRRFTILTQDVPGGTILNPRKLEFADSSVIVDWLNVIGTGVHTEVIIIKSIAQRDAVDLGPTWSTNPRYRGGSPLRVSFKADPNDRKRLMRMQFVESATWDSDFNGRIFLAGPVKDTTRFSDLVFTSTAEAGGAQLDLTRPLDLAHWGVSLVPEDSTLPAGVVCVKLGVIYTTAAGIAEPRHFARPFWLTWGEILASGNIGRLAFDYNGRSQSFDRIPYAPSFVRLSDYDPAVPADSGYLVTYGDLAFSFFGAKPVWIYDWKSPTFPGGVYGGRIARTPLNSPYGTGVSDLHLVRDWGDGVADLDFTVAYDSLQQDGFTGPGTATITRYVLFDSPLPGSINVKAERSCFTLSRAAEGGVNLGPLLTMSALKNVWGCGCIVGDQLERVAVGGELSANAGAGFSIAARTAGAMTVAIGYTPSRTDMLFAGEAYAVLLTRMIEVTGSITLTIDRDVDFAEGYLKGLVSMNGLLTGTSGAGELQWHVGTDHQTIQGRVAVSMYSMGGGPSGSSSSGKEAGLWFGINSNKDHVWVMDGISGRFGLNKAALPQFITGAYAYVSWSDAVNAYYVLSGGYQAFAALGAFAGYGGDIGGGFGVIGNVGLYLWGKILGGVVSADAWGNLQLIVGVPPAFQGEVGMHVCVFLVFCGSETVRGGFNASQGFYIY